MNAPRVEVRGSGVPCLVIAPVGVAWFEATLPRELHGDLQLIYVEPSESGDRGASIEIVVDELDEVRRSLGLERVLVFGHSANGLIALAYAAAHPEATEGVLAVATPPRMPVDGEINRRYMQEHAEPARRALFDERIALADAAEEGSIEQERLYGRADDLRRWFDVDFDPAPIERLEMLDMAWVKAVLIDDAANKDWSDIVRRVNTPVLLVLGAKDFVAPPALWEGVTLPARATVELFERSGHQPFHDESDLFLSVVRRWLGSVAGA